MPKLALLVVPLFLCSCVDFPNPYAPTRARRPDVGPDARGLLAFTDMKEGASLAHIAWGIHPAAFDGEKRKAEPRAALRFNVTNTQNQKFTLDFASPQPQPVRIKVNGHLLGELNAAGAAHFEAPLAANLVVPGTATLVEIESNAGIGILRAGFVAR